MNLTVDDLRQLAKHLSPTFKLAEHEVPEVVSALVQVGIHGEAVVNAARQGAQAVADFYHEVATDHAAALGLDEPQKGAPVESAAPVVPGANQPQLPQATGVTPEQVAAIVQNTVDAALARALDRQAAQQAPPAPAPVPEPAPADVVTEPAPAEPPADPPADPPANEPSHSGFLGGLLG